MGVQAGRERGQLTRPPETLQAARGCRDHLPLAALLSVDSTSFSSLLWSIEILRLSYLKETK